MNEHKLLNSHIQHVFINAYAYAHIYVNIYVLICFVLPPVV